MAEFDVETFLVAIENIFKSRLNAKITALNTEKNDGIVLATVDSNAYYLQELNGSMTNWSPFVFTGIENLETGPNQGPHAVHRLTIQCVIIVTDQGQDVAIGRRMLRYGRALKDVAKENWSNAGLPKCEISSLMPIDFKFMNSSELFRAVGIEIKASIG